MREDKLAHRVARPVDARRAHVFHVKKWLSNAPEVLRDVPKDDLATGVKDFEPENGEHSSHKTLGVAWLPTTDEMVLKCRPDPSLQDGVLTQVNALSQLNSYYDPLGLWSPFFVRLKKIYSGIAKSVESWTEAVPEEAALKWKEAMQELKNIHILKFNRCYVNFPPESTFELHGFADASTDFIGAGVYLRASYKGDHQCALILGKSRIIPSKEIASFSIARKELLAVVMVADLLNQCKQAITFNIKKTVIWTDNTTVIKWCACDSKELLVFVRNRVDKILRQLGGGLPRYVESAKNPADVATRPLTKDIK